MIGASSWTPQIRKIEKIDLSSAAYALHLQDKSNGSNEGGPRQRAEALAALTCAFNSSSISKPSPPKPSGMGQGSQRAAAVAALSSVLMAEKKSPDKTRLRSSRSPSPKTSPPGILQRSMLNTWEMEMSRKENAFIINTVFVLQFQSLLHFKCSIDSSIYCWFLWRVALLAILKSEVNHNMEDVSLIRRLTMICSWNKNRRAPCWSQNRYSRGPGGHREGRSRFNVRKQPWGLGSGAKVHRGW